MNELMQLEVNALREMEGENPNKMAAEQYGLLVEGIRRVGFLQPILVRRDGEGYVVVDGCHRLRAAREVGLAQVDCVVMDGGDKAEALAKALRVGMNRLRGEVDLAAAGRIIVDLHDQGWNASDLLLTGFSTDELADLMRVVGNIRPDDIMAGPVEPEPEPEEKARPWVLEVAFENKDDFARAKKALRKAAGKGGDMARGLLLLIGE